MNFLIAGLTVMAVCLAIQAISVAAAVKYFATHSHQRNSRRRRITTFWQLTIMMLLLMAGNIGQVAIWAILYRMLDAFPDFETALYFSGVTFTSLGYGDVVLTAPVRLLAPLQAATGLIMFGITTAVFIAIVQNAERK